MSADQTLAIDHDPYERLQLILNPDGTLTRFLPIPNSPPSADPSQPTPALSKDITINPSKNTWARVYLPREALENSSSSPAKPKLPVVIGFHGGGFVLFTAASTIWHDFCVNMCVDLPAVVVSVDYRLAPEHRLPAAYDDAVEALHWVKTTPDDWLKEFADFDKCFLMGGSAGGNIAYHTGLRVAESREDDLEPLKIRGLILHQPFFGGSGRTQSELRAVGSDSLPPSVSDMFWELSLPLGVDRDHEYSNPTAGSGPKVLEKVKSLGWRVLVVGCGGDALIDRQIEFVNVLQENGVQVESCFTEGGYHGEEMVELSKAKALILLCRNFMLSS